MKENEDLLVPKLPPPGTKVWLVLKHLTLADLNARGEIAKSDGVMRLSLCDNEDGANPVPVYELLIDADEMKEANEAWRWVSRWASGFIVGARYAGLELGLCLDPPQTNRHGLGKLPRPKR